MAIRLVGKLSPPTRRVCCAWKPVSTLKKRLDRGCQLRCSFTAEPGGQLVTGGVKTGLSAWEGLIKLVSSGDEGQGREDVLLILKALKLAADALDHDNEDILPCGRMRLQKSLAVASLLIGARHQNSIVNVDTIAASIVALEVLSGKLSLSAVESALGSVIASTVAGFCELKHLVDRMEIIDDRSSKKIKEMFMTSNPRSVIVSIGIVWDDIRRCSLLSIDKQQQVALEANMLYAPLAHVLGLKDAAHEMDHTSLRVLFPQSYRNTQVWHEDKTTTAISSLAGIKKAVEDSIRSDKRLREMIERVEVHDRVKSLDSFMRKLLSLHNPIIGGRKKKDIHDILGLRVVVYPRLDLEDPEGMAVKACYLILELLHGQWSHVQGRTKDYILAPKPNGYQSLHTTLILNEPIDDPSVLALHPDEHPEAETRDFASEVHGAICESASSCFGFNKQNAPAAKDGFIYDGEECDEPEDAEHQHASVLSNPATVFEVQIRTADMDHRCHFGSSSHPFYKSGMSPQMIGDDQGSARFLSESDRCVKLLTQ